MTTPRKIVKTRRSDGRLYLSKAQQFCAEATTAIMNARNDAAMLNSVHAAISAANAVCVALPKRTPSSTDPGWPPAREATGAVQKAERFVAWASQAIDAARL